MRENYIHASHRAGQLHRVLIAMFVALLIVVAGAAGAAPASAATTSISSNSSGAPIDELLQQSVRQAAEVLSGASVRVSSNQAYITAVAPIAQAVHQEFDIPASVTIGQSILESGWGTSTLTRNDHNYFGYKCPTGPNGSIVPGTYAIGCHKYRTRECVPAPCHYTYAYFNVYKSTLDSFRGYGHLLTTAPIYHSALQYRHNPDQFITAIAKHYATDPQYAVNVIKLMKTWNLYAYDNGGGGGGGGPGASSLAYTGATGADYHDAFTASAILTAGSAPVAGATVSFTLGASGPSQTCSATTDSSGAANCPLTPSQAAGTTTLTASYTGNSQTQPSHATVAFTITREENTLTYTGPTHLANGVPATLSGTLQEDGTAPIADGSVTITVGSGATQQNCIGITDSTGTVSCAIPALNQPLNDTTTLPVTATFAGNPNYQPSTDAATARLEYYTGRAFGLSAQVNLLLLSLDVPPTPDTGAIRTAQTSSTTTPCTATINLLLINTAALCADGTTSVAPGTATMTASLQHTTIGLPGLPLIVLNGITSTSASTCTGTHGSATMKLTVAGIPVTVPTAPNSVINLAGGAELIINEQLPAPGTDHGLTVNAAHLIGLGGLADIVIASSTSAAHNCI